MEIIVIIISVLLGGFLWKWQKEKEIRYKLFEEVVQHIYEYTVNRGSNKTETFIKKQKYIYLVEAYFSENTSNTYRHLMLEIDKINEKNEEDRKRLFYLTDKAIALLSQELGIKNTIHSKLYRKIPTSPISS